MEHPLQGESKPGTPAVARSECRRASVPALAEVSDSHKRHHQGMLGSAARTSSRPLTLGTSCLLRVMRTVTVVAARGAASIQCVKTRKVLRHVMAQREDWAGPADIAPRPGYPAKGQGLGLSQHLLCPWCILPSPHCTCSRHTHPYPERPAGPTWLCSRD